VSADEVRAAPRDPRATIEDDGAPRLSLPLRVQPARASALGWSSDLFALTLLIGNASVQQDGSLAARGSGPVVAVCAEYERPLTSLAPPSLALHSLSRARLQGMPTLRLPRGWFAAPIRVEITHRQARPSVRREELLSRARRFLDELDAAWRKRLGNAIEIAWPVYAPDHPGAPLLDAVGGTPLPELSLR
jgi:hypothetical protein